MSLADVQSANCVGYYTVTCDKAYNLVPINLLNMNSEEGILLGDLINEQNTPNLTKGRNANAADKVMIYNGAGYDTYFIHNNLGPAAEKAMDGKWVSELSATTECTRKLKNGEAIFFIPATGKVNPVVVTVPGQVPNQVQGKLVKGYNLIGSGMPCDFNMNGKNGDVEMTTYWTSANGFTRARNANTADKIMIYNGNGYDTYFLHNNLGPAAEKAMDGKWVSELSATTPLDKPIPANQGFFFIKYADGEIDFKPPMPYSL